ncbi:MAG: acyl carrier protein [Planctomycetaceae bacterium]|nr:acyl carrier protein [Planctomycetaceae bacterium]
MSQSIGSPAVDVGVIREVIAQHARLGRDLVDADDVLDLYSVGLTSLATVGVMLALEDRFDLEFPESMLGRDTFRSIANIQEAIQSLLA